ncbi:MAG TPA: helix-turn-helix domain-containing protein [Candidatus Sulfotelmatobacter sp.]|jgi:cytoskeletal protein RodZ|nr:helix-turn-helix domain-containing protein [Candidatus Sulfotelmatobacter sp.]
MARGTFGERLKRERELREVTPEEITQATRIGSRFLEALENEDWDKLPGGVFNRGFVRSIAHYLGLDEEAFLGEYDLAYAAHADQMAQKHALKLEDRIPPTPLWIPVALVLGILLLAAAIIFGGVYAWRRFARHSTPKPAATFATPTTNFCTNTSAWPLRPGENRHFFAKTEFLAAADDSSVVLLELNREAMPPVGAPDTSGTIILISKN